MFFLATVAEIFGMLWGFYGTQYSRRSLLIIYLLIASIVSFFVAVIPTSPSKDLSINTVLIMFFAFCGKALVSSIFYLIYHYASKMYPTRVRNTLISYACCFGRFGAIIAPQIILLRFLVWSPMPYFVFAATMLLACLAVFCMSCDKKIDFAY